MMNTIKAKLETSKFGGDEPHLTINIDGKPLDVLLHKHYPDKNLLGVVPTLLDWLDDKKEKQLVWSRINSNDKQNAPILMCPDDMDLWCTVIIAEIEKTGNTVNWLRLGIDDSSSKNMPYSIGTTVNWLDKIPPMTFDTKEYQIFIDTFKQVLHSK